MKQSGGGWSDHPLTVAGIHQAERLAKDIADMKEKLAIRYIYSSDLCRTMQTAQIIADRLRLPVKPLPQFREVNNGDLAGMKNDIATVRYPGLFRNQMKWEQCYPGGESPSQFYERINAAWADFSKEILSENENVMLVTHGGVIHVIRTILENRLYSNSEKHRKVNHAEMIVLSYQNGAWKEII